ncbi:hypothetical protein ABTX82_16780 [Streptomyces lavendulae]|uniref:hypothetical protein n=1 Tax=Streptomyces lavendulae TaxID=1914 RepID=UPI003319C3C1
MATVARAIPVDQPADPHAKAVENLAGQGLGRNEISKHLGISRWQVSKIATRLGIAFDGSNLAEANSARAERFAQARQEKAQMLMEGLDDLYSRLYETSDDKGVMYVEKAIESRIASITKLLDGTEPDASEHAKSLLGGLMDGIKLVHFELESREARGELPPPRYPDLTPQEEFPND